MALTKPSTKNQLPNIQAPRIHSFNKKVAINYTHKTTPRHSLLNIVDDSTGVLTKFNGMKDKVESGSFEDGLTDFIDKTISTLATWGGTIVASIGNAIKTVDWTGGIIIRFTSESLHQIVIHGSNFNFLFIYSNGIRNLSINSRKKQNNAPHNFKTKRWAKTPLL